MKTIFRIICLLAVGLFVWICVLVAISLQKPVDTFRSDLTPTSQIGVKPHIVEEYPSANELRQNEWGGQNHSVYIDDAIKKILRDPDSYRFISATRWTQDIPSYGAKAWICNATFRAKNGFGGYANPQETGIIFDSNGARVLNPILEKKPNAMTAARTQRNEAAG